MNQTANTAPAAAQAPDQLAAVIDELAEERINARKNKKGARVIAAFDVLEDVLILRGDPSAIAERLDEYVAAFKV